MLVQLCLSKIKAENFVTTTLQKGKNNTIYPFFYRKDLKSVDTHVLERKWMFILITTEISHLKNNHEVKGEA